LGVAFGVSVLGSIFLALMFGRVVDDYFAFHGEQGVTQVEHDKAVIELEDWAARVTDDRWRAFLDRLPDTTADAYEAIVANAYLSAYQNTLLVILGVIVVMILVSFAFAKKKILPVDDCG
jgi:multidrug efflux pump subunit AcrB